MYYKSLLFQIVYFISVVSLATSFKLLFIDGLMLPTLRVYLDPKGCFQLSASAPGVIYSIVFLTIVFNVIIGHYFFNHKSSYHLRELIKEEKESYWFLTFRYYLALISAVLIVFAVGRAFFELTGLSRLYLPGESAREVTLGQGVTFYIFDKMPCIELSLPGILLLCLVVLAHFLVAALVKKSKLLPFVQALFLVVVNGGFVVLCIKGYTLEMLTLAYLNIVTSMLAGIFCHFASDYWCSYWAFDQKFIKIRCESGRLAKLPLPAPSTPKSQSALASYFIWFYSFLAFTQLASWYFLYNSYYDKTGDLTAARPYLFLAIVWLFLAFLFVRSSADFSLFEKIQGKIMPLPLDFYLLYLRLVKPLLNIYSLTWSKVHKKSLVGLGLSFLDPTQGLIKNSACYDDQIVFIASPYEGFWTFININVPKVVDYFRESWKERVQEENVIIDELRLESYNPNLCVLRKAAHNPKDVQLLEGYFERTYDSVAKKSRPIQDRIDSIEARDRDLIEFVNTSELCKGACPVSPRSGLTKLDQLTECLNNAAVNASAFIE